MGRDFGVIEPVNGRWIWPIADMDIGDYFHVAHEDREPERVRNYVKMRAYQLGRTFTVNKTGEEHEGFTRVTRVDPQRQMAPTAPRVEYGSLKPRIDECYDKSFEAMGIPWPMFAVGQEFFAKSAQIVEPRREHYVLWMELPDDSKPVDPRFAGSLAAFQAEAWVQRSFHVKLEKHGVRVTRLRNAMTYQQLEEALALME